MSQNPDTPAEVYQSKGDRFTLGLSPTPNCVFTGRRADGTPFRRRLRTTETRAHLNINDSLKVLKATYPAEVFASLTLYLDPRGPSLRLYPLGAPVYLKSTQQHLGQR